MIVRRLQEAAQSERRVASENWESLRLLLKEDRMGFSMHVTTIYAGTTTRIHYKNHLEAVLCIQGEGELEDLSTGKTYPLSEGTIYALDQHDLHNLHAKTELKLVCVFNPALIGKEVHDASGVYPLEAEPIGNSE